MLLGAYTRYYYCAKLPRKFVDTSTQRAEGQTRNKEKLGEAAAGVKSETCERGEERRRGLTAAVAAPCKISNNSNQFFAAACCPLPVVVSGQCKKTARLWLEPLCCSSALLPLANISCGPKLRRVKKCRADCWLNFNAIINQRTAGAGLDSI